MTREELQQRIEKTQVKIEKIDKRIAKWSKGMNEEALRLCKNFFHTNNNKDYHIAREYVKSHSYDETVCNDDFNKGPQMDELLTAYSDLLQTQALLERYYNQLEKINAFENGDRVEVIWDFVQAWKENAYEYYIEICNKYIELRKNHDKAYEEYKTTKEYEDAVAFAKRYHPSYMIDQIVRGEFNDKYYGGISQQAMSFVDYNKVNTERLNKVLAQEAQRKYETLIAQIEEITGSITDVSNLRVGAKADLNGIVIGEKGKAKVETFSAGGYNTDIIVNVKHGQIFHYRTKVTKLK